MNHDYDRSNAVLERFKTNVYPPTFEGWLDATRDMTRVLYPDIPIQGKFEDPDAFLKRLQKYIRNNSGRSVLMDAVGAVVFGVHVGDHLLKWFRGGRWERRGSDPTYAADPCVRWGDESNGTAVYPVTRAAKFFRDPTDDLVSFYSGLKHLEAVIAAVENAEPGEWVDMPGDFRARRENPD